MSFLATVIGRAWNCELRGAKNHFSNAFAIRNSQLCVLPLASFLTSPYLSPHDPRRILVFYRRLLVYHREPRRAHIHD